MFEITASLRAPAPGRLLKPGLALSRLRPVTLEAVADELRRFYWAYQGACLARIVPGVVGEVLPDDWDDLLRAILEQCEAWDWFEPDWDMLDMDYQSWMQAAEEDYFAQWLEFIPVQRYGFSDYDESWPAQYPALALLKGLLHGDWGEEILASLIKQYGLEADWSTIYQYELEERVATADFSGYERPLCWLPEMARIACGSTGHELLDFSSYFEDDPTYYRWDSDLERVKELWQTAKPSVERMREFLQWCDGPGEMQAVVDALVGPREKTKRKRGRGAADTLVEMLTP